jgi:protein CpxP
VALTFGADDQQHRNCTPEGVEMNPILVTSRVAARRILAASLLASAAAVALPVVAMPMGGMGQHGGHGMHGGMHGGMGGQFSERMLAAVDATPEQRAQIRQIMDAARKDLQGSQDSRRALRQEAMRVFSQPNVDANAVEALRQKQLAQHDQASRRMSQAMLDAARVLTPEQRQKLSQRMERGRQMMERHRMERRSLDAPKG